MYGVNYNKYLISSINKELKDLFAKHNYKDYLQIKKISRNVQMRHTSADTYYASKSSAYGVEFEECDLLVKLKQVKGFIPSDESLYKSPFAAVIFSSAATIIFSYSAIDEILKDIEYAYFNTIEFSSKRGYVDEVYCELRIRDLIFDLYVDIVRLEAEQYNIIEGNSLNDNLEELKEKIDFNFSIIEKLESKLNHYDFSRLHLIYTTT
jgi:hypothetical protein